MTKYNINNLVGELKNSRRCIDYQLDLFNYYIFSSCYTEYSDKYRSSYGGSYGGYGGYGGYSFPSFLSEYYPKIKVDTVPASIISRAVSSFSSAILPKNEESIIYSYDYEKATQKKYVPDNRLNYDITSANVTNIVQSYLSPPSSTFSEAINIAIRAYLEEGFAAIVYNQNGIMRAYPAIDTWFIRSANLQMIDYALVYDRTNDASIVKWLKDEGIIENDSDISGLPLNLKKDSITERRLGHLFIREESKYIEIIFLDNSNQEIVRIEHKEAPILIANQSETNNGYGIGDGIRSISAIINANNIQLQMTKSVNLMVSPPYLIDASFDYKSKKHFDNDWDLGSISLVPGALNVSEKSKDNPNVRESAPQQLLDVTRISLQAFLTYYQDQINMIERIHSTDIFSVTATQGATATEIRERGALAIREYRGKVSNFYASILEPLMHLVFNKLNMDSAFEGVRKTPEFKAIKRINPDFSLENYSIEIFSFEQEKNKLLDLQKIQSKIELTNALGSELAEEEVRNIKDSIEETLS